MPKAQWLAVFFAGLALIGLSITALATGELLGKSVAVTLKDGSFIQGTVTAEAVDSITIGLGDNAFVIK